ncbi:hypothetical protein ABFS82_02G097400 [Erythranthe guttata]|nr:PREDICTED: microtubule-binding protein TANGLED [Erythranthe guttata]|eukprot:XP_012857119.1 PREDICTED: microtubule-binding protein TANGLED [Erythranthe guttata]
MVARSPPKQQQRKMVVAPPPLSPTLLRETVKKVDMCMARLQELQYTVAGGTKMISGVRLSPNSTRTYLRTSLRCKHESLRIKNATGQRSPSGKLPTNNTETEEWRRMSLPAMLLGETMGEILQASQFARNIVQSVSSNTRKPTTDDPTTPLTEKRRKQKQTETAQQQHSELHARRKMEKQTMWSESEKPSSIQRAKSRINFKASSSSPVHKRDCDKENCRYIANRISPRNRPWARKTVLFPNPLFHSSPPTSNHQKFSKTYTPVVTRNRQTPHKFLIKSPKAISPSKFQVKIKAPPVSISPTRAANLGKKSPKASLSAVAKLRRSFSPSRLANRLASPLKNRNNVQKNEGSSSSLAMTTAAAKLRRSFSPSRIANRLVSPLKSRKLLLVHNNNNNKNEGNIMSGLKQRPMSLSVQFSPRRI